MNQIELFARLVWSERIPLDDADVLQAALFDLPASEIGKTLFALDADDFAFRADTFGQKVQYSDWSTTYIRNTPARFDPETIQQPPSLRFERFGLIDQTVLLGSATPNTYSADDELTRIPPKAALRRVWRQQPEIDDSSKTNGLAIDIESASDDAVATKIAANCRLCPIRTSPTRHRITLHPDVATTN